MRNYYMKFFRKRKSVFGNADQVPRKTSGDITNGRYNSSVSMLFVTDNFRFFVLISPFVGKRRFVDNMSSLFLS